MLRTRTSFHLARPGAFGLSASPSLPTGLVVSLSAAAAVWAAAGEATASSHHHHHHHSQGPRLPSLLSSGGASVLEPLLRGARVGSCGRWSATGALQVTRRCCSASAPPTPPPKPQPEKGETVEKTPEKGQDSDGAKASNSGPSKAATNSAAGEDAAPRQAATSSAGAPAGDGGSNGSGSADGTSQPAKGTGTKQDGKADIDETFAHDRHIPKGFEAFYAASLLGKIPPKKPPVDAVSRAFAMSAQERALIAEMNKRERLHKTWRNLAIVMCLLTTVVTYRWLNAQAKLDADVSQYAAVLVNVPEHRAVYMDEKHKFIGVRNFIDYEAFEKLCDPDKDILVAFSAYYPWVPMMLLCLLPVLAIMNAGFNGSARMISTMVQAEKGRFSFNRESTVATRLKDVAGLTEAKHEVVEVIDFLKHPERYQALGARLPKGVLLDGPPGVGKTLLAKAVAGEAMVPFVSCSGSEFEEVYVGVGAQRVRELFREAHSCKPCVVFVDEIDAFGRKRKSDGNGSSRGTLNAFLSELDGFKDSSGIMVLAATNRADILDNALTRSGRFDRKISLEKPSFKDRAAIAKVHLQPLKLDPVSSVDNYAETLAGLTPGCSGADIFNICNEAAIQAARLDAPYVGVTHFHSAAERVLVGLEKTAVKYTPNEKERIAYHEAGVVVLNWFQKDTDPVIKTTILPRGRHRTGVTQRLPQNVYISTEDRLMQEIVGKLGGYVSEEHFFKDVSTSAAQNLEDATRMATRMVCVYGMKPSTIGHLGFEIDREDTIQKPFGPVVEDAVDAAVEETVQACLRRARALLQEHLQKTRVVAGLLLTQETLTARDLWFALGDRPVMSKEFETYLES